MDNFVQTVSLIPYLCGVGDKFCLKIFKANSETLNSVEQPYSMQPDYVDDLLSLGLRATLQTDSGFTLSQLMLLIQRDEYPFFSNYLPEISNTVIDTYWFAAAQQVSIEDSPASNILFSEQFDEEGHYLPFSSLFYCKKKELFFHPPCPRCSKMLLLCRDDELLGEFNLPHYSKSRNRYLYCPTCTPLHGGPWYTKSRHNEDSAVVKNLEQLIQDFGSVQGTIEPETCFPCSTCENHTNCFDPIPQDFDHIKAFSFYPFYMIISPDITCSGHHYLAAMSGASEQQLNNFWSKRGILPAFHGNIAEVFNNTKDCYLYPVEDSYHFLEVLYLKLQFINSVVDRLLTSPHLHSAHSYLTAHSLGISLKVHSALPHFWTLNVVNSGLCGNLANLVPSPKYPETNQAYIIGLLWFTTLLSNENQDEADIIQHLHLLLENSRDNPLVLQELNSSFQSEQIFWSGTCCYGETTQWNRQWEKVLNAGYTLLYSGYHGDMVDKSSIHSSIHGCIDELKNHLLPPQHIQGESIDKAENLEIFNILKTVEHRWKEEIEDSGPEIKNSPQDSEESTSHAQQLVENSQSQNTISTDDSEQTVIIPSGSEQPQPPGVNLEKGGSTELPSDFEETVLISPQNDIQEQIAPVPIERQPQTKISPSTPADEDDLEKTVRIKPRQDAESIEPQTQTKSPLITEEINTQQVDDDDDFLTETVVLRPTKKDG